jgi:hypothetical protein
MKTNVCLLFITLLSFLELFVYTVLSFVLSLHLPVVSSIIIFSR